MRLRRIPGVQKKLKEYPCILVEDPKQSAGNWQKQFAACAPLVLEIGIGRGQFIREAARRDPQKNFVGLELREEMLYQTIQRMEGEIPPNLRLLWLNAAFMEEVFAPGEVSCIYINFPDPWPKNAHAKRRLTHKNYWQIYQKILTLDGLVQLKTDTQSLYEFSLAHLAEVGWQIKEADTDYHLKEDPANIITEYENRYRRQGKPIYRIITSPPA